MKHPDVSKVFCVGLKSLRDELEAVGIAVVGADEHIYPPDNPLHMDLFEAYELDQQVQAVVIGLDIEFTYSKLALAALYVNELNCKLIATNEDACMMVNGRRFPSAGLMVSSIMVGV